MNVKLLTVILMLNACSYVQATSKNVSADYFLKKENARLMAENGELRKVMAIDARGILPYDERIMPEQILANSVDLNAALKAERKELEAAKVKFDAKSAPESYSTQLLKKSSFALINNASHVINVYNFLFAKKSPSIVNVKPRQSVMDSVFANANRKK